MREIYYEHIEEAAFLYNQRNNLLVEPDGDLEYQSEVEERIEAHIDGLELGGEQSRPVLKEYIDSDDEGEFFTAIYSLLRMGKTEWEETFEILRSEPVSFPKALIIALRFFDSSRSDAIIEKLSSWLTSDCPVQRAIATEVLGYKHYFIPYSTLEGLFADNDMAVKTAAMKAVNRIEPALGKKIAYAVLMKGTADSPLVEACFENLFICREEVVFQIALRYCKGEYPFHPMAPVLFGLSAAPTNHQVLADMISSDKIDRSVFQAIGLTGKINLLEKLLPLEGNPEYEPLIQEAAHIILGVDPPEFNNEPDENLPPFSLSKLLSSRKIPDSKLKCYRLGRSLTDENETELLTMASAIYRRWWYLNTCHNEGSNQTVEYDDLAEYQYRYLRAC